MIDLAMEAPIDLLSNLTLITDFDFALTHLFKESQAYTSYYERAVKQGREVILDNSVNELGQPVTLEEMEEVNRFLHPKYIIPPDHLNDLEATISVLDEAIELWGKDKLIPVIQGTSFEEVVECGKLLKDHYNFSIVSIPYDITLAHRSKLPEWDSNKAVLNELGHTRVGAIKALVKKGIVFNRIHLLGLNSLEELAVYNDPTIWNNNKSWGGFKPKVTIDTGAPITNAVWGQKFGLDPLISKGIYFNYFEYNEFQQPDIKEIWYWNICILKGWLAHEY